MSGEVVERSQWYSTHHGRRHVVPYNHPFECRAKGRWVGRNVFAVLIDEFPDSFPDVEAVRAAASECKLVLNGAPATENATFVHGDTLVHLVHRVEPSVPATPLELLLCEADLLAINKPAGVPVHHAGRYRRNTVVEILQTERPDLDLGGNGGLHILHRLDRQVSGVLLLPRTALTASRLHASLRDGRMRKRYVARVCGKLDAAATFCVTAPVRVRSSNGSTVTDCCEQCTGSNSGKHATTIVRALSHDAASATSLVLCEPITGRSHQLRLHLQRVGHPIVNDPLYGNARTDAHSRGAEDIAVAPEAGVASEAGPSSNEEGQASLGEGPAMAGGAVDADFRKRPRIGGPKAGAFTPPAADSDELWLHAWTYACDSGERTFEVTAPLPAWCGPFASTPLPELRDLDFADDPVPLASELGQGFLAACQSKDRQAFDLLWPHFERQSGDTMCGPATIAIAMRASIAAGDKMGSAGREGSLRRTAMQILKPTKACHTPASPASGVESQASIEIDEELVLSSQTVLAVHRVRAPGVGMTLEGLHQMLLSLDVNSAEAVYARGPNCASGSQTTAAGEIAAQHHGLDELRTCLRAAPQRVVLLNYHMSTAGQRPYGGHFSLVAAYHHESDRFLVLDVWPRTGPCWISGPRLWAALVSTDTDSGRSRGWVVADVW